MYRLCMRGVSGIDSRRKPLWIGGRRETAVGCVEGALPYFMMMIYTYSIHAARYTGIDSKFSSYLLLTYTEVNLNLHLLHVFYIPNLF